MSEISRYYTDSSKSILEFGLFILNFVVVWHIVILISDQLLRDAFETFGPVAEIRCFQDKGFAFVRWVLLEAAYVLVSYS